jgi:hypothetical protein
LLASQISRFGARQRGATERSGSECAVVKNIFWVVGLVLAVLISACSIEPGGERPGFWLSGEVNHDPVSDWTFTDDIREILIETRTRYFVPHSVTIWCVSIDGELYVGASSPDYPKERYWIRNARRDPNVRLKIGDQIYERRLELIDDQERTDFVDSFYGKKYDYDVTVDYEPLVYWRVVDRT